MSNFSTLFFPVSTVITNIDRLNPSYASILMTISTSTGLINTNNSTLYQIPWNAIEWQTNGSVISGSTVNDNIVIDQTGVYRVSLRYASYDMFSGNNTLTVRVWYSNAGIINSAGTGTLLTTIGDGWTGTTANGLAQKQAEYVFRVLTVPFWMSATFSHTGATGGAFGVQGFPVFNNNDGTQPYWYVERLGNL